MSFKVHPDHTNRLIIPVIAVITLILTKCTTPEPSLQQKFSDHITYLASDALEGREAGTASERKAAQYIADQFEEAGLLPLGTDGYYQDFEFLQGKNVDSAGTSLFIDGQTLSLETDFYPLNFSGSGQMDGELIHIGFGIQAPELDYDDYKGAGPLTGKIAVFSISSPDGIHPHSKYLAYHSLRERARLAIDNGAVAVICYNDDPTAENPGKDYSENIRALDKPVIFLTKPDQVTGKLGAQLQVSIQEEFREGRNVIGWIDNEADHFVVLGAHYDHLGYGHAGGSLYRGDEMVHNGADDNASGTAMLIELGRELRSRQDLNQMNYLLIAFSAEEKGLLGANYFTKNATIDLDQVSYMINMDMVGRLDTADMDIAINGAGTSPVWKPLLDSLAPAELKVVTSESGVGPSDHTAFYLRDIPVLHFFTGTHQDYHKPSDDSELINYSGMELVFNYIMGINSELRGNGKIAFTKTQDDQARSAPRFTVTLGVVPDYMYEGRGLKIDGVSEDKPAQRAGVQKGDIVVRIGEWSVEDIYAYMEVLSKLNAGDKSEIEVLRGEERVKMAIEF